VRGCLLVAGLLEIHMAWRIGAEQLSQVGPRKPKQREGDVGFQANQVLL
jgi:hypothetical protein